MTDLKHMTQQATDLDEVKLEAARREEAAALKKEQQKAAAIAEAERVAIAWARSMKRAFKGILTHRERVKNLSRKSMYEI